MLCNKNVIFRSKTEKILMAALAGTGLTRVVSGSNIVYVVSSWSFDSKMRNILSNHCHQKGERILMEVASPALSAPVGTLKQQQ